jgi:hypothetical protein
VGDWLRSINCGQYIELFRSKCYSIPALTCIDLVLGNNINGENLMEIDQAALREMGIKKIGDRVRINSGAKQLRSREYRRGSKRNMNRVRVLENYALVQYLTFPSNHSQLLTILPSLLHLQDLLDHYIPHVPSLYPGRIRECLDKLQELILAMLALVRSLHPVQAHPLSNRRTEAFAQNVSEA